MDVDANELRSAVERLHGGTATLTQSVPVKETFQGVTVWDGIVHVFDLAGTLRPPVLTPGRRQ